MRYVICYDTPSDRRRARVAKCLAAYGIRVQFSLFECELTAGLLSEVGARLSQMIERSEDNIRVYPVCAQCTRGISVLGIPDPVGMNEPAFPF